MILWASLHLVPTGHHKLYKYRPSSSFHGVSYQYEASHSPNWPSPLSHWAITLCNSSPTTTAMSFRRFYESWLQSHRRHLHHLHRHLSNPIPDALQPLVDSMLAHYQTYFDAKLRHPHLHAGDWATPLEAAFQWVAGWRPTIAFHVFYTELGAKFNARLDDILRDSHRGDLGDVSAEQLARIGVLQEETVRRENSISVEMGRWQESMSDPLVDLEEKVKEVELIIGKADELRMTTLRLLVAALNPIQAAEFLVAAAELQIGIHEWGLFIKP